MTTCPGTPQFLVLTVAKHCRRSGGLTAAAIMAVAAGLLITVLAASPAEAARQKQDSPEIPLPAHMILIKANGFIEKDELQQAIHTLEEFRAEGREKHKPGKSDRHGYTHYLIDFTLANCYLLTDNIRKAVPLYASTVEKSPDFTPAWLNLAKGYYDLGEFVDAARCFIKSYETDENKVAERLYYAAVCYTSASENSKALDTFERILADHPGDVKLEWKETLVQIYFNLDRPRSALPYIEELAAQTTGRKKKQWQELLLNIYMTLNMKQKALDYARFLTREYPTEAKWWKALAHLHLSENRFKPGLVAMTVYGHLTPLSADEKKLMAELNLSVGVPVEATRYYEDMLKAEYDQKIVKRLAESFMLLHRPSEALKWVKKGLEHSDDPELAMMQGNLLYELKQFDEAMAVFESLGRREAQDAGQAHLMAGYCAWNTDDLEKARRAFQMAAKYPAQKKTARRLLRQLDNALGQSAG